MEKFALFIPFILMLLFLYGIYKFYRFRKSRNLDELGGVAKPTNIYWKKARIVLFILTPFVVIFEVITDDIGGETIGIIATIFWFWVSKEIFLYYDDKSIIQNYPKLSILAISVGVFIISFILGQLINF